MKSYNPKKIEEKWQKEWKKQKLYKTVENKKKPKSYVLDMFPYPSGEGLHVGHPKGYIATDIYSRYKKMNGYNILHPMGWDAFGLPAENYALKNKIHPRVAVKKNIARFKEQLEKIGFNYDWEREINTTDPKYYKWTQWIFLRMFKKGLAYQSDEPINWCPSCKTGLANEDLEGNQCERCGTVVEKKPIRQWVLKITEYAERMLKDLDGLDWPESIKESQRNWIGKSEGALIKFELKTKNEKLKTDMEVFTTRPDTLFGASYCVLAPEHPFVNEQIRNPKSEIRNKSEIQKYINKTKTKTEIERVDGTKEKTGVELKGIKAVNPANNQEIPIFIADYALAHYGTGAIMAVPAHDERDFEFAKKYNLPSIQVICQFYPETKCPILDNAYVGGGKLVASGKFDGMDNEKAKSAITKFVGGKMKTTYKLRDWVFSRQRYWGEPIPIIHCEKCGIVPVPEKDLPVELPNVKNYEPTGTGESPLAGIDEWVNVKCPKCGGQGKRETNTMPQWAGSSWYYLRYIDSHNDKVFVDKEKEKYWSPVDMYVGGAEHATRHLIYARFWHKFLYDIGAVNYKEPFKRLQHVGLIQASDGRKMSKRYNNVINPDDIVKAYGADTLRLYEMFMGPFDQAIPWSSESMVGLRRFLDKIWKLQHHLAASPPSELGNSVFKLESLLHKTIKKVEEDIENFKFNTAISQMMILANEMEKAEFVSKNNFEMFLKILAPFAPHIAEELWNEFGNKKSVHLAPWPKYDTEKIKENTFQLVAQINGKVRDTFEARIGIPQKEAEELTLKRENVKKWIVDKSIKKTIFVPDKLINIVINSI